MLELERFNGWIYSWHWTDRDSDGLNRSDLNRSDLLILWILSKAIVHKNIWMCYVLPSISMMNHVESNILRMCICIRTEEIEKFFNNWTSGSKEPFLEMEKWRTPRNGKVSAKTGKKRNVPQNRPVWRACCRSMWASLGKKETCETRKSILMFLWGGPTMLAHEPEAFRSEMASNCCNQSNQPPCCSLHHPLDMAWWPQKALLWLAQI